MKEAVAPLKWHKRHVDLSPVWRSCETWFSHPALLGLFLSLQSCAAPTRYEGIGIEGVLADRPICTQFSDEQCYRLADLAKIARLAQANDKWAQLEMAERSASGCGLSRDLGQTHRLLVRSATPIGGDARAYLPNDEGGAITRTKRLNTTTFVEGLPNAKARLADFRRGEFEPLPISSWPAAVCGESSEQREGQP